MNKKILFYYSKLGLGGAERSLTRFMNTLASDGNDVTLLTRYGDGSGLNEVDEKIRVLSFSYSSEFLDKKGLELFCGRVKSELEKQFFKLRTKLKKEHFDLMVLGSHGMCPYPMLDIFYIDKTIRCIRNDLRICAGHESGIASIRKYKDLTDGYLCVSGTAKESFDESVPEEAGKSFVLYNFLNLEQMHKLASESNNPFENDGLFHIVSVCRVSDVAKGVFRMVDICERLVNEGLSFKWYLVGDGEDLKETQERISDKQLENIFITVGKKENPFGYYKYADLVAVLSYYEGLCGIVNEAKACGAAVIATEFSGIHEQITDGVNGIIVDNNEDAIFYGMKQLLENKEKLSEIKNSVYPQEILNDNIKLQKFYSIMNWEK